MLMGEVVEAWKLVDRPDASGEQIRAFCAKYYTIVPTVTRLVNEDRSTDVLEWRFSGSNGKSRGGTAPTLAICGRLGGVGGRPYHVGTVSDADGAVSVLAAAFKLSAAYDLNEPTEGDVLIITHICPNAPTRDSIVKGQMDSPVPMERLLNFEAPAAADALISVDTTRGHRIINHTGIAVTATLLDGYLLRVSEDILTLYSDVTNDLPHVLPVTMQDMLAHDAGIYRINSIMIPGNVFEGPLIGLATVSTSLVYGFAASAAPPSTLEVAARFCVEAARRYGRGLLSFYDEKEFAKIVARFGTMSALVGRV